jgi:hypothetical protein
VVDAVRNQMPAAAVMMAKLTISAALGTFRGE